MAKTGNPGTTICRERPAPVVANRASPAAARSNAVRDSRPRSASGDPGAGWHIPMHVRHRLFQLRMTRYLTSLPCHATSGLSTVATPAPLFMITITSDNSSRGDINDNSCSTMTPMTNMAAMLSRRSLNARQRSNSRSVTAPAKRYSNITCLSMRLVL